MRGTNGYTLAEVVIAIVFVAVVLGPLLLFAARIHDLNSAIGQQARKDARRTWADQAVVAGFDPSRAVGLSATTNAAIPAVSAPPVVIGTPASEPGLATLVPLRIEVDATTHGRIGSAGLQIGQGVPGAPRGVPETPLPPVTMAPPVVTPADQTIVSVSELAPTSDGEPYTLDIAAVGASSAIVRLVLNQPHATRVGSGRVDQMVTAADLARQVSGIAWTEYAGDAAEGDESSALADGRTRWVVKRADGRRQLYEPSSVVSFSYQISLGAPVLVHGLVEAPTGAALAFTYDAYTYVRSGVTMLRIDFPAATRAAFGSAWASLGVGYNWTFAGQGGPVSGDARGFFAPETLAFWTDEVRVAAVSNLPRGAQADAGAWTLRRVKVELGVPLLTSVADGSGFHVPGQLHFSAPSTVPDARLSFEAGTMLSTGPTLALTVLP